jgi:hypothetical protein
MSEERLAFNGTFDCEFCFESYGVRVKIESNSRRLLEEVRQVAMAALVDRVVFIDNPGKPLKHTFGVAFDGAKYILYINGSRISDNPSAKAFFKYLNSRIRIEVAEYAKSNVFLHAGVVGRNGYAILMPANSYAGKTTLTAELVRNGAEYYSDEYAVLDESGKVHPFARKLSMRGPKAGEEKQVSAEELGGRSGETPIPVGMVLLTNFEKGASWNPKVLSPGKGILEIIPQTIPILQSAEFSLKVLDLVARRAIIVQSPRGDAKNFAKTLLAFFDSHTKLAEVT